MRKRTQYEIKTAAKIGCRVEDIRGFRWNEYSEVRNGKYLMHKFVMWDGNENLFQYDKSPHGKPIVAPHKYFQLITVKSRFVAISIEDLEPDASLTSSLLWQIKTKPTD